MNDDAQWCQSLFSSLENNGIWAVPRSGLVFQKQGDKLVLVEKMPHSPDMPVSVIELNEFQNDDFKSIKAHFAEADIIVERAPIFPGIECDNCGEDLAVGIDHFCPVIGTVVRIEEVED